MDAALQARADNKGVEKRFFHAHAGAKNQKASVSALPFDF